MKRTCSHRGHSVAEYEVIATNEERCRWSDEQLVNFADTGDVQRKEHFGGKVVWLGPALSTEPAEPGKELQKFRVTVYID